MFVKNVSNEAIENYNCGRGVFVTLKPGEAVEIIDENIALNFIRLLSPLVEKSEEVKKPKESPIKKSEIKLGAAPEVKRTGLKKLLRRK